MVYENDVMSEARVRQWCIMFKNGLTNIHGEVWSSRPSIVNAELLRKTNEKIHKNRHFTISELSLEFPQISQTLFGVVMQDLGYRKFCSRRVPKLLSEDHKKQCMTPSLTSLEAYNKHGESLINCVVTGDKTKQQYGVGSHKSSH